MPSNLCSKCGKATGPDTTGVVSSLQTDFCNCPKVGQATQEAPMRLVEGERGGEGNGEAFHGGTHDGGPSNSQGDNGAHKPHSGKEPATATASTQSRDALDLAVDVTSFPLERYKPIKLLSTGEAGDNYLCKDSLLEKKVLVKVLPPISADQLIEFQKEAKAVCQLKHDNIATPIDFGATASGAPYMVLDFYQGITLKTFIERSGALAPSAAVKVFGQLADALAYAHEQKLLHRDIKSSNLLLNITNPDDMKLTLIDFGVERVKAITREPIVHQGKNVTGNPGYLPPEKVQGGYDERSEIYALGCTLFEALTGKLPFDGNSATETITMQVRKGSPPLASVRYDIEFPPQLEGLVATCLAKNPANRYASMSDLKAALKPIEGQLRYAARMKNNASYARLNAKYAEADGTADGTGMQFQSIDASKALPLKRPASLDRPNSDPSANAQDNAAVSASHDAALTASLASAGTAASTTSKPGRSTLINVGIVLFIVATVSVFALGATLMLGLENRQPFASLMGFISKLDVAEGLVSYYKPSDDHSPAEFEILKPGPSMGKSQIVHLTVPRDVEIAGLVIPAKPRDYIGQEWTAKYKKNETTDTNVLNQVENKTTKPETELGRIIARIQGMFSVMVGKPILVDATAILPYYTPDWGRHQGRQFSRTWEQHDMLFKPVKHPIEAPVSSFKVAAFDPAEETAVVLVKTDYWMQKGKSPPYLKFSMVKRDWTWRIANITRIPEEFWNSPWMATQ